MGKLYFGDNLYVLRDHKNFPDECVDLVYLDPPFNSKRDYNVLFKTPKGQSSDAQITAFEDSWVWGDQTEREYTELLHQDNTDVCEMVQHMRLFLKDTPIMAYLVFMSNRLLELRRVLKPTGSLYLHCDPTASHYLKIILDTVFGPTNFQNEIIWKRTSAHSSSNKYGPVHDVLLFYSKSNKYVWNPVFTPHDPAYVEKFYRYTSPDGRRYMADNLTAAGIRHGSSGKPWHDIDISAKGNHWKFTVERLEELDKEGRIYWPKVDGGMPRYKRYLDEIPGVALQDIFADIPPIGAQAAERLGYPTQKPLVLLERIVQASSNPGDLVLDPFCGCGTAVHAAQNLGREWVGIDITHLAIGLIEKRMKDAFPGIKFEVHGTPKDLGGARDLAERDKYQFQLWACALVGAQPYKGGKKGADTGIDGLIFFQDEAKGTAKKIIVSVKGGENVGRTMLADLKNTVEREQAQMGLFVTLTPPTKPMEHEAISAGYYDSPHMGAYPKIQILTIEGLLSGTEGPRYPDLTRGGLSFKKAKVEEKKGKQLGLGLEDSIDCK
jgi:DNA modification methylase